MRALAAIAFAALAGCHADQEVRVTVGASAASVSFSSLSCDATVGTATSHFQIENGALTIPPAKSFVIVVPDSFSGEMAITVAATGGGEVVAGGSGRATLAPGVVDVMIDLLPPPMNSDGGANDASAPPTCQTRPNAYHCDDFESGDYDKKFWMLSPNETGGTVTVDTTRAHQGSYALHITTDPAMPGTRVGAGLSMAQGVTPPDQGLFIRAWVYFDTLPQGFADDQLLGIQSVTFSGMTLGESTGHAELDGWVDFLPVETHGKDLTFQAGTWQCIEWYVMAPSISNQTFDMGEPSDVRFFIDSGEVLDLRHVIPREMLSGFSVGRGFTAAVQEPKHELWIDDLLIGKTPIGCP
jgi:hypothetical protein